MSGVEVAGILLGVFPLTISALEHYRDTAEVLGVFWKIRKEYKKWTHSLNICRLAFEQNLEEFLLPFIADEDELQELLAEPGGPKWKNPELEERLRLRLPKSYDLYLESIDHIKEVMEEIRHELGIDKAGFQAKITDNDDKVSMAGSKGSMETIMSKTNIEFQTRRIKMSFSQGKRDKLFEQLSDYNDELRTLLDTSDRIAASRQKTALKKRPTSNKGLWQFWRHADRLYDLLTQSWHCECKGLHRANLLLQHRTSPKVEFIISFIYAQRDLKSKPWSCQKTKISLLEEEWQPAASTVKFVPASAQSSTQSISNSTESQEKPASVSSAPPKKPSLRKSILGKFKKEKNLSPPVRQVYPVLLELFTETKYSHHGNPSSEPLPIPAELPQITLTEDSSPATTENDSAMTEIKNLCDTIASYQFDSQCRSCLRGKECRYALSPVESHLQAPTAYNAVSLAEILARNGGTTVSRKQRYAIALTIASSHLQLHSTPWITSRWNKKDIFFLLDSHKSNTVLLDQPYISQHFSDRPSSAAEIPTSDDSSLSSLGILLLELCFGIPLEEHATRLKYPTDGVPNPFLDMAAALEWSPRVVEEAGPEYFDAVTWCLRNMPRSWTSEGMLEQGREELFEKVVVPLGYCCDQLGAGFSGR